MKKHLMCVVVVIGAAWSVGQAQTPGGGSVIRLDPALDAIISPRANLEILSKGPSGVEGPVWSKDGQYLLFTERGQTPRGRVNKITPDGNISPVFEPTDNAIGLVLDREGRMILCSEKALIRIEKDGKRTVLADSFEGRPLDGPNDAAVKRSDGSIYFSDELSVFRWTDGKLTQLMKATNPEGNVVNGRPRNRVVNGLTLSPDDRYLYVVVVPQPPIPRRIARYELRSDGTIIGDPRPGKTLTDERIWVPLPDHNPPHPPPSREWGQPDGIKVDLKGNVYLGGPDVDARGALKGPGGIWIVSQEGKHLGTVLIPGGHNNLAFGDSDGKGLYFTLGTGLARIRLNAPAI